MITTEYRKRMKTIQEMKNHVHLMIDNSNKKNEEYLKIKQLKETLSSLSEYYYEQEPDCFKICILDDVIIKRGEVIKLRTNVDEIDLDKVDLVFDGYIPMDGCLFLYAAKDENDKTCIYAKNNIQNHDIEKFRHYEFCDSDVMITRLSGNIKINGGSTIGLAMSRGDIFQKRLKK